MRVDTLRKTIHAESDRLLVTGASGFVGTALCAELFRLGFSVRAAVRSATTHVANSQTLAIGDINSETDWTAALTDIKVVVHLAARVHVMKDKSDNALEASRKINVNGTVTLARQAVKAGVQRFIFISSIKVNGEATASGQCFSAEDLPAPLDAYGISKREAEDALRQLATDTGMEVVIIRPPLVYGPGVKGNFRITLRCLDRRMPLPLGTIHNKRSFVALDNLVDLIITCITHPAAANQTFLAGDGHDLSTTELLRYLGRALGKPARLLPFPVAVLKRIAKLLGKQDIAQRLCDSLQIDISKTRNLLNWTPPVSVEDALKKSVAGYHGKD